jgi:hypothetical protein
LAARRGMKSEKVGEGRRPRVISPAPKGKTISAS